MLGIPDTYERFTSLTAILLRPCGDLSQDVFPHLPYDRLIQTAKGPGRSMQEPAAEGDPGCYHTRPRGLEKINGILNGPRAKHLPNLPRFRLFF